MRKDSLKEEVTGSDLDDTDYYDTSDDTSDDDNEPNIDDGLLDAVFDELPGKNEYFQLRKQLKKRKCPSVSQSVCLSVSTSFSANKSTK